MDDWEPTILFANYDATCHTEGCENKDVVLRIAAQRETPAILCGPCMVPITDVVYVEDI